MIRHGLIACNDMMPSYLEIFQAKALAEKNMRDLLAQKEQAERSVSMHPPFVPPPPSLNFLNWFAVFMDCLHVIFAEISGDSGC